MVILHGNMRETSESRSNVHDVPDAMTASSLQPLVNMIPGHVITIHQGLLNVGMRVRIGERTDLRVRWPLGSRTTPELKPALPIKAVIPAEAVHLEAGISGLGNDVGIGGSDESFESNRRMGDGWWRSCIIVIRWYSNAAARTQVRIGYLGFGIQ